MTATFRCLSNIYSIYRAYVIYIEPIYRAYILYSLDDYTAYSAWYTPWCLRTLSNTLPQIINVDVRHSISF